MGSETRRSNPSLMRALQDTPFAFSFFQAVQLLQRYLGGVQVGGRGPAAEETLRLVPAVSMSFPAADLVAVEPVAASASRPERYRLTTSFLGLYSSDSPLPTFYTEDLLWREDDQKAVRDFLDIFHHRILSLFYRAWEKYRLPVQFREGTDDYSRRVFSLLGLGTVQLIGSSGLPSVRLLRYAGLFTRKPHSASGMAGMLRDYFALPAIAVNQCRERWTPIDPAQRNRLGVMNSMLGKDLSIGAKVRDFGSKFRVVIGPLALPDYLRFLPESKDYAAVINLVRLYATDRLDFDLELRLKAEETPPLRLSSNSPLRLGWTSCFPRPARDPSVVLRQPAIPSPQTTFPWPRHENRATHPSSRSE
jgi:type VI secretion system protein ImpH